MHSLLLTVDGSRAATNAVKYVINLLHNGYSAHVHVLHVLPIVFPVSDFEFPDYALIEKAQKQQAKHILDAACKLLEEAGIEHTRHVESGPISQTIVNYANKHHCEQIIMGTRGMSTFGNWILGSTATQVAHLANMPVTLVK